MKTLHNSFRFRVNKPSDCLINIIVEVGTILPFLDVWSCYADISLFIAAKTINTAINLKFAKHDQIVGLPFKIH